jgi:hypothetical protein
MARIVLAVVAGVSLGLVFVSAAAAATVTIGPPDVSGYQASVGSADGTFAQLTQPTAGVYLTAPVDGVITAWHVHGDTTYTGGGTLALRVLRANADGTFTGVATSAAVTATGSDGSPAHPVSIPIQAGDYIGVETRGTISPSVYITQPSGATYGDWAPRLADGSNGAPSSSGGGRLLLNAVESLGPAVSGVSPSSGSTAGGQAVTISGSNLDGATGVSFGGTPAGTFTASATQITATAPAHAVGTVDVQVIGPGGQSPAQSGDHYSYINPVVTPPSITIASPANSATYEQSQAVNAIYSCTAPAPAGVTSCAGPVTNGAPIDTSTLGSRTFTVNAQDTDGGTATKTVGYTVVAAGTPIVSGAGETAKTWRENDTLPHIAGKNKLPIGTTFSFALNERATVTLSFTQQAAGRKVHGKCVAPSVMDRHKPRCTRMIAAGKLTFTGHPGANKVRFAGRISANKKLKPGRYTLRISATNTQRKRSKPQSLTFNIVK